MMRRSRSPVGLRPAAVAVVALSWAGFGPDVLSAQGDRAEYRRAVPTDRSDFTRTKEEGFPLNVNPKIVAAAEAQLADDDLVMGVVVGGEARAYPVNYMNGPHNEVVNDQLGGLPIAPTW